MGQPKHEGINPMITWNTIKSRLGLSESTTGQTILNAITHDGRLATAHHVFVPRIQHKGSIPLFVKQAISNGCQAIMIDRSAARSLHEIPEHILAVVPDFYQALDTLYPIFYPKIPAHRVAITGTDGKTSTSHLLHQLWTATKKPNAAIGTLGFFSNTEQPAPFTMPDGMTTPPQPLMYELLAWYKTNYDIDHVVFEATSHALAQERLNPLRVHTAILTNFAQDHLDYHGNLYAYWQAKWRLFTGCMVDQEPAFAIISNTVPLSISDQELISSSVSIIRYGNDTKAIPGAENATYRILGKTAKSQKVLFRVMGKEWETQIPLIGEFQISNVLAALLAFVCTGGKLDDAIPILSHLKPVLGRMEHVVEYNGANIYVDYSHTPQGIALALQALRPCTSGKLGIVFGCGGERDTLKRPLMGQEAEKYSDWVIVTDDNCRGEDPAEIRQHILVGCPSALSITPRPAALQYAIDQLAPGDGLLVAGKGHETTQIIGNHIIQHSDQAWIKEYCQKNAPITS